MARLQASTKGRELGRVAVSRRINELGSMWGAAEKNARLRRRMRRKKGMSRATAARVDSEPDLWTEKRMLASLFLTRGRKCRAKGRPSRGELEVRAGMVSSASTAQPNYGGWRRREAKVLRGSGEAEFANAEVSGKKRWTCQDRVELPIRRVVVRR